MEVSGYLYAPAALLLEINQLYPWSRRMGWIQSRTERRGEEKSLLSLLKPSHGSMVVQLILCQKSNIWYGYYKYIHTDCTLHKKW
jgi:hypothetical protein